MSCRGILNADSKKFLGGKFEGEEANQQNGTECDDVKFSLKKQSRQPLIYANQYVRHSKQ